MKKQYQVKLAKAPEYNSIWAFSLEKSGAFHYGNGTAVAVTKDGDIFEIVDTRYDNSVIKDLGKWAESYLDSFFDKRYEPAWEEVI